MIWGKPVKSAVLVSLALVARKFRPFASRSYPVQLAQDRGYVETFVVRSAQRFEMSAMFGTRLRYHESRSASPLRPKAHIHPLEGSVIT